MEDFGLVSIITPAYNSEQFISETIDSILSQTYTHWELLITDDCSTDSTIKIIEQYTRQDSRIKLFRLSKNSGAGVCRNNSIKEAKGKFIAFCDSDDCWMPQKLEKQLAFMATKDCVLSYSSYMTCNERGDIQGIVIGSRETSYERIKKDNCIGCLTVVYNCEKIGKQYMPEIRKRQDWGLWITMLKVCKKAHGMKEPLAIYRLHSNSISHDKKSLVFHNLRVYREILQYSLFKSYLYFLFFFMPTYAFKKIVQKLINR